MEKTAPILKLFYTREDELEFIRCDMIRKAEKEDYFIVAKLANQLWANHSLQDLEVEFKEYLASKKDCIFICYQEKEAIAFAHCSLRDEYVEGSTTAPVTYLEGIFVKENYRKKGIAQELVFACEKWAQEHDCKEIASDCEIENELSYSFHLKSGFQEINRVICFVKQI
jgi:aminoglycoside 6'-N-acetyltransferase I